MWVIDTCVVLDVFENDPRFGLVSARILEKLLADGIAISPVTMVELSAAFAGDLSELNRFLDEAGISRPSAPGAPMCRAGVPRGCRNARSPIF
jgi:hypothetical protein